jgi:hypothetical protein
MGVAGCRRTEGGISILVKSAYGLVSSLIPSTSPKSPVGGSFKGGRTVILCALVPTIGKPSRRAPDHGPAARRIWSAGRNISSSLDSSSWTSSAGLAKTATSSVENFDTPSSKLGIGGAHAQPPPPPGLVRVYRTPFTLRRRCCLLLPLVGFGSESESAYSIESTRPWTNWT